MRMLQQLVRNIVLIILDCAVLQICLYIIPAHVFACLLKWEMMKV